ncbi:putative transcription factor MYB-HB-like family [Helianthus annuus]|uniref:Transcriptional adapter n=1 Tax=Helianthus annuus TaxID=4232 RepID=A0A9K3MWD3_HELAN|nr:transcriptional adapter ADA2 isoform X2 [Helianthus annuus]KAF5778369.1 putative transcription factor MYB/SANT family [Helianthus annuus]KAJ0489780.1 putative transcription factor MYB/SANT family [Helianthus annuus]KAJ0493771.1 putative transcription factor MYB/SANT family [Helianthus annuus]KAJ0505695.1 putative transcription factor MYB/SANT family [Helianthus annuus]KAJ0675364.1 putative transcription factor MYB/SANT family [Helianthus annuus]
MGRSRAVNHSTEEDSNQSRSKRKRTTSNLENLEAATSGQGMSEGKKALYHCNYCNKDISGKIRIKCACCSDFDLCVECFSVGAEVYPHKSNHPYRVMDNLSFPLFCSDWNADEEILLLEGIEMYGLANWNEVAEHVGTKSKSQCIEHYNTIYMNSPCFPLPDMSHVMGKNREELLAMARGGEVAKGHQTGGELSVKEESPFSARIKVEDIRKENSAGRPLSDVGSVGGSSIVNASTGAGKRTSSIIPSDKSGDGIKIEDSHTDRSFGEKKLRTSVEEGPSMTELSGYNFKRQEFEVEYDNDAEQLLADMEFKETDTDPERELKLRVLRIYSKRLDERKRRKDFILERNLLYGDPFEQGLSPEEKEICRRYRVFMRFHTKEEHEELLKTIIEEHRIRKRIEDLQEARAAGCRGSADAERYIEQKRKREAEEKARGLKDNVLPGPSGKFLQRANHLKGDVDTGGKDSSAPGGLAIASLDDWDVSGHLGAELLSEAEKRLCSEMKVLPTHYLGMLEKLTIEVLNGHIAQKSDAHRLFNVDPNKVDRVYDMLLKKGIGQP